MFIQTSAAILVLAPILTTIAMSYGVDQVYFGLIIVMSLALRMITPPFVVFCHLRRGKSARREEHSTAGVVRVDRICGADGYYICSCHHAVAG